MRQSPCTSVTGLPSVTIKMTESNSEGSHINAAIKLDKDPSYCCGPLWLAPHVYLAALPSGSIILDLRQDRYFGLSQEQASELSKLVFGWPKGADYSSLSKDGFSSVTNEVKEFFVSNGILTVDQRIGKSAAPVRLTSKATLRALGENLEKSVTIEPIYISRFIFACARAAYSLRFSPLERVIARAEKRRQESTQRTDFDTDRAASLVRIFMRLRPYLFTAHDRCLFHALALLNFLAYFGVFPMWVIGVQTQPFAAHSWVQYDDLVLDSTPEEVCYYTPILAV